jgi:hypothetical protein
MVWLDFRNGYGEQKNDLQRILQRTDSCEQRSKATNGLDKSPRLMPGLANGWRHSVEAKGHAPALFSACC